MQQEQRPADPMLCGRVKHSNKVKALLGGDQTGVIGIGLVLTGRQYGAH